MLYLTLSLCISLSPRRSRCQDRMKHTNILLVETPERENEWGGSQKRWEGLAGDDASFTSTETEKEGRLGGRLLDCHLSEEGYTGWAGSLDAELTIEAILCPLEMGRLSVLPVFRHWEVGHWGQRCCGFRSTAIGALDSLI